MDILSLNRRIFTDKSTIGDLYYRGDPFSNTLEDTCRRVKISGQAAIPAGRYKIELVTSPKYQRVMPRLLNVPDYEGVLIHWGNSNLDTEGCILTGVYDPTKPDWVSSSRKNFDELFLRLKEEKEPIYINITGGLNRV